MDLGSQMTSSLSFSSESNENSGQYDNQNKGKKVWNYFTNSNFLSSVVEKAKVRKPFEIIRLFNISDNKLYSIKISE
jgi:hypothetical protein